jgi:Uma2 family endonuclease
VSTITRHITTAEQLLDAGDIGRCELVRGELHMMTPAGGEHGGIANESAFQITAFVKKHKLGRVYAAKTGFVLQRNPDTVLAADVAFVRSDRVPKGRGRRGFFEGHPDFVVEVLSPNDRAEEVDEKVRDWLDAGCQLVWVVNPKSESVSIHRPPRHAETLMRRDRIDGDQVLPGFQTEIATFFDLD